jgi:hypothetical protein
MLEVPVLYICAFFSQYSLYRVGLSGRDYEDICMTTYVGILPYFKTILTQVPLRELE